MNKTKIAWADLTWNPVTGCSPASEGCDHCYARAMARRFNKFKTPDSDDGYVPEPGEKEINPDYFKVVLHPEKLDEPIHRRKPARIFVCSMSDLFHPDVPDDFIFRVLLRIAYSPQHTFLILTKRAERMRNIFTSLGMEKILKCDNKTAYLYLPNVWLGVTAENQPRADERIPVLLKIPAAKRFVSFEPMLGPARIKEHLMEFQACDNFLRGKKRGDIIIPKLDWVIVGGESGPGARECREEWIKEVYDQCEAAKVAFFFKQFGSNFIPECDGTDECGPHRHCPPECHEEGRQHFEGFTWMNRREWPK